MIGLITIWTIAFFLANVLQCLPISENWDGFSPPPGTCINVLIMFYQVEAWSDVFTDVMILSMPLPWVCGLFLTLFTYQDLMRENSPLKTTEDRINRGIGHSEVFQHSFIKYVLIDTSSGNFRWPLYGRGL